MTLSTISIIAGIILFAAFIFMLYMAHKAMNIEQTYDNGELSPIDPSERFYMPSFHTHNKPIKRYTQEECIAEYGKSRSHKWNLNKQKKALLYQIKDMEQRQSHSIFKCDFSAEIAAKQKEVAEIYVEIDKCDNLERALDDRMTALFKEREEDEKPIIYLIYYPAMVAAIIAILYGIGWIWYYLCGGFAFWITDFGFFGSILYGLVTVGALAFVLGFIAILFGWKPKM